MHTHALGLVYLLYCTCVHSTSRRCARTLAAARLFAYSVCLLMWNKVVVYCGCITQSYFGSMPVHFRQCTHAWCGARDALAVSWGKRYSCSDNIPTVDCVCIGSFTLLRDNCRTMPVALA